MTASWVGGLSGGGTEEKGVMDMDNSVVIAGEGRYKGTKCHWEKYNKEI